MATWGHTLHKLWRRSWADWWTLGQAMMLTVLVRAGLSVYSLDGVARGLRRVAQWLPQWSRPTPAYRNRAAWAANAVGYRFLPERPCLTQALVLQYLLLRRGDRSAELHIGVTKHDGNLQAHAWVERKGKVLIGGTASPYKYERLQDLDEKIGS